MENLKLGKIMALHLFRHGETDWNHAGRFQDQDSSELTRRGILQAQKVGHKIKNINFDKFYCSPSLRTKQTAFHMWPDKVGKIEYLESLLEIKLGPLEGQFYEDVKLNDPSSYDHFFHKPHLFKLNGAETFAEVTVRAVDAITDIAIKNMNQTVAIVSHGAFIKAFLTKIDKKGLHEIWEPPFMDNCAHSIVIFESDNFFRIVQFANIKRNI